MRIICHHSTLSQDKLCLRGCQPEVREGERRLQDRIRLGELPIESEEPFLAAAKAGKSWDDGDAFAPVHGIGSRSDDLVRQEELPPAEGFW